MFLGEKHIFGKEGEGGDFLHRVLPLVCVVACEEKISRTGSRADELETDRLLFFSIRIKIHPWLVSMMDISLSSMYSYFFFTFTSYLTSFNTGTIGTCWEHPGSDKQITAGYMP